MNERIINWDETVILCGGNGPLAQELLSMLKTDLPRQKQILITAYEKNDTQMMRDIVHQILGTCSYISLPTTKKAAERMHNAIHSTPEDLIQAKDRLIHAMNEVMIERIEKLHS